MKYRIIKNICKDGSEFYTVKYKYKLWPFWFNEKQMTGVDGDMITIKFSSKNIALKHIEREKASIAKCRGNQVNLKIIIHEE